MAQMSKEEAMNFFSEFYGGEHHIPGKIHEFGQGWMIKHDRGDLATYDFNGLTRLVFMAHQKCLRVSIMPLNFSTIKLIVHKREKEGGMTEKHPTLSDAIKSYNEKREPKDQVLL